MRVVRSGEIESAGEVARARIGAGVALGLLAAAALLASALEAHAAPQPAATAGPPLAPQQPTQPQPTQPQPTQQQQPTQQPQPTQPQQPSSTSAPPAALAGQDKEKALVLLAEGNQKLDEGNYVEALARFKAAFAAYGSPRLHYNLAQTLNELDRPVEALRHYEQFVAGVPQDEMPAQWSTASEQIFKLQGRIASLALQCNLAGVAVIIDGVDAGTTPLAAPVRLLPGRHIVILDKPTYERRVLELELKDGVTHTERVELLTTAAALAQRQEFQRAEAARQAAELRLDEEQAAASRASERRRRTFRTAAWISLGVGAAATAAAATAGLLSWRETAEVEDAPPGAPWAGEVEEHYERAASYRRLFYLGAATAVVGLAAGGGLLLYSRRAAAPARRAAVERAALVPLLPLHHADRGGGLAVTGSF
jgi:tetratricopeptide (TPR) repeat protein